MNLKPHYKRLIILGIVITLIILLYFLGFFEFFTFDYFKHHLTETQRFIHEHYNYSVLIFITSLTLAVTACIPLGIFTPLISGMLFGWLPGALYAIIGASLGAFIAFSVSRYVIGDFIQQRFEKQLAAFNHELKHYGYIYLLGLHFFPITPFFILNVLAGLTRLSAFTFVWTTVVGIAPSYLIYTYIGNQVSEINEITDLLSGNVFFAFILLKILSFVTVSIGRFGHVAKKHIAKKIRKS